MVSNFVMVFRLVYLLGALCAYAESIGDRWWSHVKFLADDKLEGREAGSPGYQAAAQYVAGEFERAGLRPGAEGQWLQTVPFRTRRIEESASSITLLSGGVESPLTLGKEAYFESRVDSQPLTRAELVFAGYGLVVPQLGHDDLAGLDLKGKVAVILSGAPAGWPGTLAAHVQSSDIRWAAIQKAGAIGLITIPKVQTTPWARASAMRVRPSMTAVIPGESAAGSPQLGIIFNPDHAELLFTGAQHTFAEVLAAAKAEKPLPKFPLRKSIVATAAWTRGELQSANVIGRIPGRTKESVIVSAHLDHIGKTTSFAGDGIFNGAMDNASGVAALIEVAKLLKGRKLRRSVVFVALTGEEKGLQGSKYFAAVSAKNAVANCNMDMFMPLHDLKALTFLGAEESTLGDIAEGVAKKFGLDVIPDPVPEQRRFTRSDQYSFVRKGIPALNFKFGYEKGSKEEAIQTAWLKERYHAVSDDLSQPVNIEGAGRFTEFLAALVESLASSKSTPATRRRLAP